MKVRTNDMAKVFIGVGHGGNDSGAVGYLVEKDVNLQMALACRDYLEANGVTVLMSRTKDENDTVSEEVLECNNFNPSLAVDIHNNAGGGDGFEVYYTKNGGEGKKLAQAIEKEVKAIGQNSRGCKTRIGDNGQDYYYFIRGTRCPAVICEGVFVDTKADAQQADTKEECKAFGYAYARGILATLGIKDKGYNGKNNSEVPKTNTVYRVQVGSYTIRSNAEKMLQRLEKDGYDAVIMTANV